MIFLFKNLQEKNKCGSLQHLFSKLIKDLKTPRRKFAINYVSKYTFIIYAVFGFFFSKIINQFLKKKLINKNFLHVNRKPWNKKKIC